MNMATNMQAVPTGGQTLRSVASAGGKAISGETFAMLLSQMSGESGGIDMAALLETDKGDAGAVGDALVDLLAGASEASPEDEDLQLYLPLLQNWRRREEGEGAQDAAALLAQLMAAMQQADATPQPGANEVSPEVAQVITQIDALLAASVAAEQNAVLANYGESIPAAQFETQLEQALNGDAEVPQIQVGETTASTASLDMAGLDYVGVDAFDASMDNVAAVGAKTSDAGAARAEETVPGTAGVEANMADIGEARVNTVAAGTAGVGTVKAEAVAGATANIDTAEVEIVAEDTTAFSTSGVGTARVDAASNDTAVAGMARVNAASNDTAVADKTSTDAVEVETAAADTAIVDKVAVAEAETFAADTPADDTGAGDAAVEYITGAGTAGAGESKVETAAAGTASVGAVGAGASSADAVGTEDARGDIAAANTKSANTAAIDTAKADAATDTAVVDADAAQAGTAGVNAANAEVNADIVGAGAAGGDGFGNGMTYDADESLPVVSQEKQATETASANKQITTAFPVEQMRYSSAIRQVQRNLKTPLERQEEIDIEALQAGVRTEKYTPITIEPTQLPAIEPKDLVDQLETGIRQNLGDKDTFVVKLRPEGLGEITVSMVAEEGRMVLSILTTSAEVARLLRQESASLQNALRPMQAEVREITAVPETTASPGGQLNFAGQNMGHSGQSMQSSRQNASTYYRRNEATEATSTVTATDARRRPKSALDSYI